MSCIDTKNPPINKRKYYYLIRSEPKLNDCDSQLHYQPAKAGRLSNCETVKKFFKKKFQFRRQSHWSLPLTDTIFNVNEKNRTVPQLQGIKDKLNNTKDKLNDYPLDTWSKFTAKRDPSSAIAWFIRNDVKAEFVTKAWCKFYECLSAYPIVKVCSNGEFNSVRIKCSSLIHVSKFVNLF